MSDPAGSFLGRWRALLPGAGRTDRSAERYRRALWTTLASGLAKGGGLLSMLVLVPVLMRYLGDERAGIWMTLSSLTILLGFADLGMGTGLMTAVARADGARDEGLARRAISSCFFVLAAVAVGLAVLWVALSPWVAWTEVLRTSAAVTPGEARGAMAAFFLATLVGLPFSIVERVQSGQQEGFASHGWQMGGTLLSLGAVLGAVGMSAGLEGILWAGLGSRSVMLVANWVWYFRVRRPAFCPRWHSFDRGTAGEMLRLGSVFLWLNVLAFNWWLVDPIVILRSLGPEAVTGYGAMQRLFAVALVGQYLVMPLWPAFGEALARGDHGWVRSTLRRALRFTLLLTAGLGLGLVLFGRPLTRLWLRSAYEPAWSLLIGMAALNLLLIVAWNLSGVLIHGKFLKRQTGWYTVAAGLALGLKLLLVRHWGLSGVVWASVIAFGLVYTPMAARLAREAVRGPEGSGGGRS